MPSPPLNARVQLIDKKRSVRSIIDWLFRSRTTGRITIAQLPNLPLAVFLAASGIRLILRPSGPSEMALRVTATGALLWWAGDEVLRGVNPWRRLLGGAVLVGQITILVLSAGT